MMIGNFKLLWCHLMSISKYSTSKEQLFAYLYQDLLNNPSKPHTTLEERGDIINVKWLLQLEQIFKRKGLKFSYLLKPPTRTCHNSNGRFYFSISSPVYEFTLER